MTATKQPANRHFYIVTTGAPMDSIVCSDCLHNVAPDVPDVQHLTPEDMEAILESEGEACCDLCGFKVNKDTTITVIAPGPSAQSAIYVCGNKRCRKQGVEWRGMTPTAARQATGGPVYCECGRLPHVRRIETS